MIIDRVKANTNKCFVLPPLKVHKIKHSLPFSRVFSLQDKEIDMGICKNNKSQLRSVLQITWPYSASAAFLPTLRSFVHAKETAFKWDLDSPLSM